MNPRDQYKKLLLELKAIRERMKTEQFTEEQLADVQAKQAEALALKAKVDELDRMDASFETLTADFDRLNSRGSVTELDRENPGELGGNGGQQQRQAFRLGRFVTESEQYRNRTRGTTTEIPVPGLFLPGQQFALQPMERFNRRVMEQYELVAGGNLTMPLTTRDRTPAIQPILPLRPTVRDALTNQTTEFNLIPFIRQDLDTTVNAAAAFEPDGTSEKPESDIGLVDDEAPVRTIATVMPVPDQVLDDVAGLQSMIEAQLVAFLAEAEDDALLNGDGTPPNLLGILNMDIQVADNTYFTSNAVAGVGEDREDIDRLTAAMTLVRRVGRAEPSSIVMSPTAFDWFLSVTNETGDYYSGNPFGTTDIPRFRGKPIIVSDKIADTKALVIDGRYFVAYDRMQARVDVGYVDRQFVQNWKTLRAEERLALAGVRPSAAVEVTFANAGA